MSPRSALDAGIIPTEARVSIDTYFQRPSTVVAQVINPLNLRGRRTNGRLQDLLKTFSNNLASMQSEVERRAEALETAPQSL